MPASSAASAVSPTPLGNEVGDHDPGTLGREACAVA
jgi:hypothetical protein